MKTTKLLLIILVTATFIIHGCKNKQKEINVFKVGIVLPLTGNSANHGNDILAGINIAYKEYKNSLDTNKFKIELLVEDNFSTTKGSVSAFEKLIQLHNPAIVIGPVASSDMLSMIPIAEKSKTILFSPAASSPKISNSGNYIYRMSLLAPDQTKAITNYALNDLKTKKAGILYMNDETGISYMESFISDFTNAGGVIVYKESYDKKDVDFKTHLLKLKTANADALYIPGVPKTVGLILKQSKELNINIKFLGNYGSEGADLLEMAKNSAEGFVYTSIPIDSNFASKYTEINKLAPPIGVPLGYDALKIVIKLIRENSNDKEKLRIALSQLKDFEGVTGNTTILPSGDASKEVILKIIVDGKFINLSK